MKRIPGSGPAPQTVVVQGLGFVGAAMAVAVACAVDENDHPYFDVTGIDLDTKTGNSRINSINSGLFPFETVDQSIIRSTGKVVLRGNLRATADPAVLKEADVVLVSVNLDIISSESGEPSVDFVHFKEAIRTLGNNIVADTLVIIETTVPPGTCVKVVKPILQQCLWDRGIDPESVLIAHSYERVMPGAAYLDSIVNFWRVYSGITDDAADRCEAFLSRIINVNKYPLTRLDTTVASETAKVLENSYRAVTIAFMEEWGRFAEDVGFDLFDVINAIRKRPTHSNMRQPGFGVGGYCLTKDPLFAGFAARELFHLGKHEFPFSSLAVATNRAMPLVTLGKLKEHFDHSLQGIRILLMGISYRQDVGDTRHSPSEVFAIGAMGEGAVILPQDPFVKYWHELQMTVTDDLPDPDLFDAVVFAVPHYNYRSIDIGEWLKHNSRCLVLDSNNVLTEVQRTALEEMNTPLISIGRG